MNAQELELDYFNFYDVADRPAGYIVGLQGQFDKYPEKVQLIRLNLFANPVRKNGEALHDKNAHLTWYDIYDPTPDPRRKVVVENQFGEQPIITGRACALLSPTWNKEEGSVFPERLDHYKVYQILHSDPVDKTVKLEDQFGGSEGKLYLAMFLAVPVKEWWEGQTFGIHNETTQIVIYRTYPSSMEETIKTRDQFSSHVLNVFRSVLLGAPSVNLEWSEMD